jgi:hypothetical protein
MTARQDPKTFCALVAKFPADVADVALAARTYLLDFMPGVYEIVWPVMKTAGYGTGPKKMSEHFIWIAPFKQHVVFGFYYGSELPDPRRLLEGTGKLMRHVKLRTAGDLDRPGLRELVERASRHRVPPLREDAAVEAELRRAREAALGA